MQSNLDVFLNAEPAGTVWCSWSAAICNQTAKSATAQRLNKLLDSKASIGDKVWNIVHTKSGSLVSLKSSSSSVYLELENSSRIALLKPRSKVTFGRIDTMQSQVFAYVGEENGNIHVLQISENGDVLRVAQCQSEFRAPVEHLLHQPVSQSGASSAAFHLWVLSDNHISLVGGTPPSVPSSLSGSTACIELNRIATFQPDGAAAHAALLRVQVRCIPTLLACSLYIIKSYSTSRPTAAGHG